jgi:aarF domain-containing kinase
MTEIDDNIKYGMIEAISHLVHRDYEAIVADFVTLDFIPPETDLRPILPVLAKVFDQALAGGGAKGINFQELAADLAQITFDYPFRIPPYFALIIRGIGVLEGIALVGDPEFAIVDEAFPYIAKRLMTDDSPRLREALRYMVYGKSGTFDAERLIDLLDAFETFTESSRSARGDLDLPEVVSRVLPNGAQQRSGGFLPTYGAGQVQTPIPLFPSLGLPSPPVFAFGSSALAPSPFTGTDDIRTREALKFLFSVEGTFFREFLLEETVKSIDALSRSQFRNFLSLLGLQNALLPVLIPGAAQRFLPLAPTMTEEDDAVVSNVAKVVNFLAGGRLSSTGFFSFDPATAAELLPYLPGVATEVLPELTRKLFGRITARVLRDVFVQE